MKRGTESIVRLGKSVEPADFSGINVLSTVILGKKESATKDFNGLFITDAVLLGKKISHSAVVTATVHGVSPLSLPDAVANTLSYVKAFGGAEQRNLPAEYTELDYIESTGTQYINTGYIPTSDIVEYGVKIYGTPINMSSLFGAEAGSTEYTGVPFTSAGYTRVYIGTAKAIAPVSVPDNQWNKYVLQTTSSTAGKVTLNGVDTDFTYSDGIIKTLEIYLFANNRNNSATQLSSNQVQSFYIKDNGILVRNFVAAKDSNNIVGMYDLVSGQFFTNAGTGDFVAGPAVAPSPDTPVDIVSNNGVLKARVNLVNTANSTKGQYISSRGSIRSSANWATSDYLPVIAGGKVTVSGLTYASSAAGFNYYDASKNKVSTIPYETGTHTYTVPNNASYIMISYRWEEDESTVKVYVGETLNAPYADGTVETINAHGKNLAIVSQSSAGLGYVKIPSSLLNKTVTLSNNSTDFLQYAIGDTPYQSIWTAVTLITTFTVTQEMIDTVGLWVRKSSTYGAMTAAELNSINLQLELGSTATEYEPYYDGGTATAEMLLKVGNNQDVQSILDGVVTRNVGVKVFDGTETFVFPNRQVFRYTLDDLPAGVKLMSNYFNGDVNPAITIAAMPDMTIKGHGTVSKSVYFKYTEKDTIAEFKQWLAAQYAAGTPVIIVYPLAEPTTETVAGQALQVTDGDNTLEITQASLSGLELEAEYGKRAE